MGWIFHKHAWCMRDDQNYRNFVAANRHNGTWAAVDIGSQHPMHILCRPNASLSARVLTGSLQAKQVLPIPALGSARPLRTCSSGETAKPGPFLCELRRRHALISGRWRPSGPPHAASDICSVAFTCLQAHCCTSSSRQKLRQSACGAASGPQRSLRRTALAAGPPTA